MIDFLKHPFVLVLTGIVSTLLILFAHNKTQGRIDDKKLQTQTRILHEIVPEASTITEMKSTVPNGPRSYWKSVKGSDTMYVFNINSPGYTSTLSFLVCISPQGVIKGLRFLEQNETPGQGSRIQEVVSDRYIWNGLFSMRSSPEKPWFCEQFKGISLRKAILIEKDLGEWHQLDTQNRTHLISRNAITAVTGATTSTQAVISGLENQAKSYLSLIQGYRNDF